MLDIVGKSKGFGGDGFLFVVGKEAVYIGREEEKHRCAEGGWKDDDGGSNIFASEYTSACEDFARGYEAARPRNIKRYVPWNYH